MERKLITRNEKSEVTVIDNVVVKRYLQHFSPSDEDNYKSKDAKCRASWEQNALQVLHEKFGINKFNGWTYRAVQLLGVGADGESLSLEYVKGQTIAGMDKKDIGLAEYHAGVWLALYHQKMVISKYQAVLYTDYTGYNILVDFENQAVVVIDPGMVWGRHGIYYEDVIFHIHSIMAHGFKKKQNPFQAVQQFLKGYTALNPPLSIVCYYKALIRELKRHDEVVGLQAEKLASGSCFTISKRWAYRVFTIILLPFYFAYLPTYLVSRRAMCTAAQGNKDQRE